MTHSEPFFLILSTSHLPLYHGPHTGICYLNYRLRFLVFVPSSSAESSSPNVAVLNNSKNLGQPEHSTSYCESPRQQLYTTVHSPRELALGKEAGSLRCWVDRVTRSREKLTDPPMPPFSLATYQKLGDSIEDTWGPGRNQVARCGMDMGVLQKHGLPTWALCTYQGGCRLLCGWCGGIRRGSTSLAVAGGNSRWGLLSLALFHCSWIGVMIPDMMRDRSSSLFL